MIHNKKITNIFSDRASYVLRKMLKEPDQRWVVRDFIGEEGISIGMAQAVLKAMEKHGYVERIKKGPHSYAVLTNKEQLIHNWVKEYTFDLNLIDTYYSPDKDVLKKIKRLLLPHQYALTLHTGANFITSYVKTEEIHMYLNLEKWPINITEIRQRLDLKELVRGGNIHFIKPFYKSTVFFNKQKINGYSVVSPLQLYLDLYNSQPRGREHAEYLKKALQEKGQKLD